MNRLMLILSMLFSLTLCAQEKGFSIRGYVSNGVGMVPAMRVTLLGDTSWNNIAKTQTDRNGMFFLDNVPEGSYILLVYGSFYPSEQEIDVHSNLTLDTVLVEETMLEPTIWYLQKTDSTSPADPYYRQYLDYRRAIDALNISYSRATLSYSVDSIPDATSVLATFRGISLEKGWLLDVYYGGGQMGGAVSFYIRQTREPKTPINEDLSETSKDLLSHLKVDFTPEGIWSAYQLAISSSYLPKFWHGGYFDYCGIFALDEVRHRSLALRDSLATTPEIHTHIDIIDADHATVTAYWWNDWVGLFEETVSVERTGNTVRFLFPDDRPSYFHAAKRTLVPYDCGIEF